MKRKVKPGSGEMFNRIAPTYDLLNRLLSFGFDQSWRYRLVRHLDLPSQSHVLDIATGTADLALGIARLYPEAYVTAIDPSAGMLEVAERKTREEELDQRIMLHTGDAQNLPFRDDAFDATCIGFGIRNIEDRQRALREMSRVTRPGRQVLILELNEPRGGLLAALARFYVHYAVPVLGWFIAGGTEYSYLRHSIANFPEPDEFCESLSEAGLKVEAVERLGLGAASLFLTRKLKTVPHDNVISIERYTRRKGNIRIWQV